MKSFVSIIVIIEKDFLYYCKMTVFIFHSIVIPFISGLWGSTRPVSEELKNVWLCICLKTKVKLLRVRLEL